MATENPGNNSNLPAPIDYYGLLATKQRILTSDREMKTMLFSDPKKFMLGSGHLLTLSQSPVASALVHNSEIYYIGDKRLNALVSGDALVQRVRDLSSEQRQEAMRILLDVMAEELGQITPEMYIDMAESSSNTDSHLEARQIDHQYRAGLAIHTGLKQIDLTMYQSAYPHYFQELERRFEETPWDDNAERLKMGFADTVETQIMPVVKPPTTSEENH